MDTYKYKPIKLPTIIAPNDDDVEEGRKRSVCRERTAVHRLLLELSEVLPRVTARRFAGEHLRRGAEEGDTDKSTNELSQGYDDNAGSSSVVEPQLQGLKTFEYHHIYVTEPSVEEGRNHIRTAASVDRSSSYASWMDSQETGASGQALMSCDDDLLIDDFRIERILSRYRPRNGIDRLPSNRHLTLTMTGGGNSLVGKVQSRLAELREIKSNRFKVKRPESGSSSRNSSSSSSSRSSNRSRKK